MERTDAVLLRRRWMHNIAHIVITFILVDNVLCENKADIKEMQTQICTSSIHDFIYDLRLRLLIKEKNIREKFKDLGEYTIKGIVETRQEIENLYKAINPKYEYQIQTDKHTHEVIAFNGEKIQLQNKINEMYDEMKTIKELYMNKHDYTNITSIIKRLEDKLEKQPEIKLDNVNLGNVTDKWVKTFSENMERMVEKIEDLNLKLKDYNANTNNVLGKHEKLLTNLIENVSVIRETSSNNNRDMNTDNLNNDTGIMKCVGERNMSVENVCMKMAECRKTVEELNALTDNNKLSDVIRDIYKNESKYDFSLILAIADSVTNLISRLIVYETVFNELSHNLDLNKLINLCKAVKCYMEILIKENNNDEILVSAEELLDSMLYRLKTGTITSMTEDLKNTSPYYSNQTITHNLLLEEIYRFDKKFCTNLFESFVDEGYNMNRNDTSVDNYIQMSLLTYIRQNENLDLRVVGLLAFYTKIENKSAWRERHLHYNVLNYIKEIINMKTRNVKSIRAKNRIETVLIPQLPPCFRALVSFDHFCIRNVGEKGYINAIMDYEAVHDGTHPKFRAFSSTDEIPFGGEWTIQYKETQGFHIHNYILNKYLCLFKYDYNSYPYVVTRTKADDSIPFFWYIDAKDDYCYIRNIYGEYMFAKTVTNTNTGKSSHLLLVVATENSLNDTDSSFFEWEIVGCPASNRKLTEYLVLMNMTKDEKVF